MIVPTPSAAQTVEGRVAGTEERVLVTLVSEDARLHSRRVTDRTGAFQLPAPGEGRYRIRVDRPGYESGQSEWVEVAGRERGQVVVDLPETPIDLEALPIPSPGSCRPALALPDRLSAAWREAEEAMRLFDWAETADHVLFDALVRQRQLENDGFTVLREEAPRMRESVLRITPPEDADDLVEHGFIREAEDGSYRYFAVTPEVLLHPRFHQTHCFRLQEGGEAVLGIAFEPRNPGADPRPDVAGILWVDAVQGLPVLLEFEYRNVDPTLVPPSVGGESIFTRFPDGSWAFAESWQRLPVLQLREDIGSGAETWSVIEILEERVQLRQARVGEEVWSVTSRSGEITGSVLDPLGAPVRGAEIRVLGTSWRARTGEDGTFSIDGLLDGAYRVAAEHSSFDDLPLAPEVATVELRDGVATPTRFAPPVPTVAAARLCQSATRTGAAVALIGQVRDSISGEPLVGIGVTVRFTDPRREGSPRHEARVTSGAGGYYLYCDAPPGEPVRLRAETPGADGSDDVRVYASREVVRQDLSVRLSTRAQPTGVFGIIRDQDSGDPIEQALIRIPEADRQALTGRNGFFSMPDVTPGLYAIEVSHIGYRDREIVVRVEGGAAMQVNVELRTDAIPIEGITVSVLPRRLFSDMVDLQHRIDLGFGDFVMREELQLRGGTLATALTGRAGVRVLTGPTRAGERFVVLRTARDLNSGVGAGGAEVRGAPAAGPEAFSFCFPAVFVDGRRWNQRRLGGIGDEPVDFTQFITDDIEAVEMYKGSASVPGAFGGGGAACGAVVIWTRRGGREVRSELGSGRGGGEESGGVQP